jgi:hypothetical protein
MATPEAAAAAVAGLHGREVQWGDHGARQRIYVRTYEPARAGFSSAGGGAPARRGGPRGAGEVGRPLGSAGRGGAGPGWAGLG